MSVDKDNDEPTSFRSTPSSDGTGGVARSGVTSPASLLPTSNQHATGQIAVGDVLNGIYLITRFIARKGIFEIYEGVNIHSADERVAIKVSLSNVAPDDLMMAMFAKEAMALTRLHHDAIVPYHFAARDLQGRPFIVRKYVDGPSLEQCFGGVRLSDEQFGELARRLARGLSAVHVSGAVHRDIAPDNILLVDGDPQRPKIIDFEIARDGIETMIAGDGFAGKLRYIAPEQLGEYNRHIGPWTDLYSLALTLLAVARGRHADMGSSTADAVHKRTLVPDLAAIPLRYRLAFERSLQPDPARRPQSMSEFIELLCESGSGPPDEVAPLVESPSERRVTQSYGKDFDKEPSSLPGGVTGGKWTAMAGGALILFLAMIGVAQWTRGRDELGQTGAEQQGEKTAGPLASSSQALATLASPLAAVPPCSWLSFDSVNSEVVRFVGGAGNPAGAQQVIAETLAEKGMGAAFLDMDDVVSFDDSMCGAVDALREFRSPAGLITSPTRSYEALEQDLTLADGGSLGQGKWAKPRFRVTGLNPDEDLIFFVIQDTWMQPLFSGRKSGKSLVELLSGTMNVDGFDVAYPTELDQTPNETYGIAIVAGKGPFPIPLFGDPWLAEPKVPIDASWPDRFRIEARAKGWRTDIFWFSVSDEVPG